MTPTEKTRSRLLDMISASERGAIIIASTKLETIRRLLTDEDPAKGILAGKLQLGEAEPAHAPVVSIGTLGGPLGGSPSGGWIEDIDIALDRVSAWLRSGDILTGETLDDVLMQAGMSRLDLDLIGYAVLVRDPVRGLMVVETRDIASASDHCIIVKITPDQRREIEHARQANGGPLALNEIGKLGGELRAAAAAAEEREGLRVRLFGGEQSDPIRRERIKQAIIRRMEDESAS